jgi:rubrerythrin
MYYIKISEDEDEDEKNTLIYYCRNCGHENKNITAENVCVSETQLRRSEKKYSQMVNEYTKYDPTLPRINTIKCPNHECISNNESQAGGVQMGSVQIGSGRPTKAEAAAKAAAKAEAEASGIPLPTIKKPRTTKLKPTAEQKEKIQKALGKQASAASAASASASASAAQQVSAQQKEEEALAQIMEEQEQEEEELEAAAKTYLASAQKETVVGPIATENDHNNREIIYLRYDDINMKYIYLCVHCNTVWKTDNRA